MGLSGSHRCGCRAASMKGVCHGEARRRAEVLLHVWDGRAREAAAIKGVDGRRVRPYAGEARRDGRPQVVEEPGLVHPARARLRLEPENDQGQSQVDIDQGIRFLGEIGRFGRRACEGGPRLLRTDRRDPVGKVGVSEANRDGFEG